MLHTCITKPMRSRVCLRKTSSSAVAKRPCDASCHRIFC